MPPCAYSDEDSLKLSFTTTSTLPASASSISARSPATPAPITRKSGFIRYSDHSPDEASSCPRDSTRVLRGARSELPGGQLRQPRAVLLFSAPPPPRNVLP